LIILIRNYMRSLKKVQYVPFYVRDVMRTQKVCVEVNRKSLGATSSWLPLGCQQFLVSVILTFIHKDAIT